MQNVELQSLDELFDFLPADQLDMVDMLRELVWECVPGVEEYLSFNIPCFRRYGMLCFIWPGAVSWGTKVWDGVEFGFSKGYLLADEDHYLDRGNRKQVFTKRFYNIQEVAQNLEKLRILIMEAAEINELLHIEKKQRRKK